MHHFLGHGVAPLIVKANLLSHVLLQMLELLFFLLHSGVLLNILDGLLFFLLKHGYSCLNLLYVNFLLKPLFSCFQHRCKIKAATFLTAVLKLWLVVTYKVTLHKRLKICCLIWLLLLLLECFGLIAAFIHFLHCLWLFHIAWRVTIFIDIFYLNQLGCRLSSRRTCHIIITALFPS